MLGYTPRTRDKFPGPEAGTPQDQRQAPPGRGTRLGPGTPPPQDQRQAPPWNQAPPPTDAVHARRYGQQVRILLECNLVSE